MFKCYLTDIKGNILNPFMQGSIKYTPLLFPSECNKNEDSKIYYVILDGYAAVSESNNNLSAPIPFSILKSFCMNIHTKAEINFHVTGFNMYCIPCNNTKYVNIFIEIETEAEASALKKGPEKYSCIEEKQYDKMSMSTKKAYDTTIFCAATEIQYSICYLRADSSQYNAIGISDKKIYTNADELTEYGNNGIPSPDTVSYCSLFINGSIQPQCNYIIREGCLELITSDTPINNQIVSIEFLTFKDKYGNKLNTSYNQCVFVSDGVKRRFTNADVVTLYSTIKIPDTNDISYWNLYINGVLQPQKNYCIKKGVLQLLTADVPLANQKIVLETVTITNNAGCLVKASVYTYNTVSDGSKVYTDKNEMRRYGCRGIISPDKCTCYDLFVNGLLQPKASYYIAEGYLIFTTEDAPDINNIITLRYIIIIQ